MQAGAPSRGEGIHGLEHEDQRSQAQSWLQSGLHPGWRSHASNRCRHQKCWQSRRQQSGTTRSAAHLSSCPDSVYCGQHVHLCHVPCRLQWGKALDECLLLCEQRTSAADGRSFAELFTAARIWTDFEGSDHAPVWADLQLARPLPTANRAPAMDLRNMTTSRGARPLPPVVRVSVCQHAALAIRCKAGRICEFALALCNAGCCCGQVLSKGRSRDGYRLRR